ncbi:hypothetical protein RBH29_11470 [Herbivorax sp. ANBcel31]|uniref:hypothetical protein n=1 Tax=Herbivorax sp. ANBcel31 TaxID=3069754 RepID=UPI0027B76FD2|nr:hypothetical protein [Herbivorax sp. ANBcel31]MDQ2087047.1 hypothetical protein [Herbivorax sp. ANBcel31]
MLKTKSKIIASLIVSVLVVSLISNIAIASTSSGINLAMDTYQTYYHDDGFVNAIYTRGSEFKFYFNSSDGVDPHRTTIFTSKETSIGSGTYEPWQVADVRVTSSGGQDGAIFFNDITLPEEGRYKVMIFARDNNNRIIFRQELKVINSNWIYDGLLNVVDEVSITGLNNGKIQIDAYVHNIHVDAIDADDFRIGLSHVESMRRSRGMHASYWASDVNVTQDPNNRRAYYVTATVDPDFYNDRPGEYYIQLAVRSGPDRRSWEHWGTMIGRFLMEDIF